jgi:hypothetical protein
VISPNAPPQVPVLQSPANGATGVSIPVTLSWQAATGAASYRIQVAKDNIFSQLSFDQSNISTNSVSVSGLAVNTQYFWRVKAFNEMGESNWSDVWSFTTAAQGGDIWSSLMSMAALMIVMGMMSSMMPKEGG